MLILPVAGFMYAVSIDYLKYDTGKTVSEIYWVVYLFYWIPIVPTCALLVNLSDSPTNCYGYSHPFVYDKCGFNYPILQKIDTNCGII